MKAIICLLVLMFSLSSGGYYFSSYDFDSMKNQIDEMQRRQECLERQNREQREYSDCLKDIQANTYCSITEGALF